MRRCVFVFLVLTATFVFSGCAKQDSGSLQQSLSAYDHLVTVRLDGANEAVVTEIFGKIVSSAEGVVAAKRYATQIVADNPQASYIIWRVTTNGVDSFELQTTIMEMAREIIRAEGYLTMQGVPYRYSMSEIGMLPGLRPSDATSRQIAFVIDRELARDREMSGW